MPYLRDVRNSLLIAHDQGLVSDEELLLLLKANSSKNPEFSYEKYARFSIESIEEPECLSEFRVEKKDLPLLADALRLPDTFHCNQRTTADKLEGLCILLRRMSFPCRYSDLLARFGRPVPELSMISNTVMNYIYDIHGHKLCQWNHHILNPRYFDTYADAISNKGAALQNCFGFIDGTIRPICRPSKEQRIMFNGHKRVHSLKFQSVTVPNGLIANLFGPVEGRRHDAGILADSKLLDSLDQYAFNTNGDPVCLYGDPAYPIRVHLQVPFRQNAITPAMEAFNSSMSSVRESVEWTFGDVVKSFKALDFKSNLKIGLSSVGKMYLVCAIIQNAITCLYGNLTSNFFEIEPPSLHDYFR